MNSADTFTSLCITDIEAFVRSSQEETLELEFKTVSRSDLSVREDRRNFACAVSGFANSAGGVIVWGVDARRNAEGVDCASKLAEIPSIATFVSRLSQLTGEAVMPRVDGIQHRAVPTSGGAGFAVTLVPESDSGPHMARLGEHRYYKRSGSSCYCMEHFDIADMFGRRRRPKLVVTTRVVSAGRDAQIVLGLRNDGRGSARAPYLAFNCPAPFKRNELGLDGNRNEGMRRLKFPGQDLPFRYGEDTSFVIHPGIVHEVASVWLGFDPKSLPDQDVTIDYAVCAEDLSLERGSVSVRIDDIR